MSDLVDASAIVLAGGRAKRFGAEKLAANLSGAPLLHHAVRVVAMTCEEVLVVGTPTGLPIELPAGLGSTPAIVLDVDAYGGPLVALVHAMSFTTRARVLVVGGDMPELQPSVLRRLLVFGDDQDGACLVIDGGPQPLPLGLDRAATLARGAELVGTGERSLRCLVAALDMELIPEVGWRDLDPDARSLRDVDRPEDLGI